MRKLFTLLIALFLVTTVTLGQVNYTFNFNTNSTGWTGNFSYFTGATACGGTGGAMRRNLYSSATTGQLISPLTGNSAGGLITMSYDYKVCNWSANTVGTPNPWGSFDVQYGATATGPWTTVATVNQTNHVVSGSCATKTLTFTPPAGPVYIRFSATWSAGDYYLNYDNIVMSEATGPCAGTPTPGNTLSTASVICAYNSFTLSLQNATTGSGVTYQWQSSPNGTAWTNFGTNAASQSVTQTAATYYQCIVTCSGSSGTSTPVLVTMQPDYTTCYCIPTTTYGCTDGDVIARVQLNTLDNNSGTGCPSGTLGYSNYTNYSSNPEWTTNLMPASTYTCTVWAGQYSEGYAAWIDYNDDGYFDNATERIGYSNGQVAGSGTAGVLGSSASFPIALACSPPAGPHRLRVRAMYNISGSAVTPCTNNSYGEVEDYIITITGAPPCAAPGTLATAVCTTTDATLNINMNCSEATDFDFEYGPVGFTQGTGTMLVAQPLTINAGIGSYTITGLSVNTKYDVYYRANCGGSTTSTWGGPYVITTKMDCAGGSYTEAETCGTDSNGGCNMTTPAFEPIVVDQTVCGTAWCDGTNRDTDWYTFTLTQTQTVTLTATAQFDGTLGFIASPCPATAFLFSSTFLAGATGSLTANLAAGTYYAFMAPTSFTTVVACQNGADYHLTMTAFTGCYPPTALTATNITTNSADLGWTPAGTETLWNIEWGLSGFTQGTGTIIDKTSSNPYTLGSLSSGTAYAYYVQTDCGGGTTSTWAGPFTFTTICESAVAPYTQVFTSTSIPACWSQSGTPQAWLFTTTWSDYGADALADHTAGGTTNYAGVDGSGTTGLTGITLLSNMIDVSGVVNPQVSFYMFNNNNSTVVLADEQKLTLDIWDGAAWQTGAFVWDYGQNAAGWQQKVVSLGAYTISGPIQLRFVVDKGTGSPFYDDIIIDDVVVEATPTCLVPTSLVVTPGSTSADIDWTETGTATQWIVEYGPQGFVLGTGTSVPVSSKPYTLTPLTSNTNYSFYVRADCGGGDLSAWSAVKNFTTTQVPATLPLTEGFETGYGDWAVVNGTQTNKWYAGTAAAYSGTQSSYISNDAGVTNTFNVDAASVVHIYRDITFPAGADGYSLSFWYKAVGEACCDYLQVFIVDPVTSPVAGTQLTSGQVGSNLNMQANYTQAFISLPNSLGGTTKRLVFSWKNDGSLGTQPPVSLDDILLQTATYATVTTDVTSSIAAVTATSGGNVTADGNLPVTARGVCWNITGNPTIGDNLTIDGTGTGPFVSSMTGLTPGQTYYVKAYATNAIGTSYGTEEVFTTLYNITFQVNMSQQTVSPLGVHIAGNFQGWDPAATALTDMGSGVWAVTLPLAAGDYQYKFINGNAWGQDESIPGACNVGGNRGVTVTITETLPLVCFGSCSNCVTQIPLTLTVDMANQTVSPLGVHVAGSFQGWNPGSTVMTQIPATTMYEVMIYVDENSTHQYKFINGNDWPDSEIVPAACGVDNGFGGFNRTVSVTTGMYSADVVCFGECSLCAPATKTLNVTAFLEGLYAGAMTMNKAQDDMGDHFPGTVADQITVELHNETDYATIEHSAANVDLNTDGTATVTIPASFSGMYWITIKHRNSVETTSAAVVDFSGATIDYNFSTAAAQAFGDNQIDLGEGVFGIFIGDANQDGIIDGDDLVYMDPDVIAGNIGYLASDLNGDGLVDGDDLVKGDANIIAGIALATP